MTDFTKSLFRGSKFTKSNLVESFIDGETIPSIITATSAPILSLLTSIDPPEDGFTNGTFVSSAGTIVSAEPIYNVVDETTPRPVGANVFVAVVVTDSEGNTRTFLTETQTVVPLTLTTLTLPFFNPVTADDTPADAFNGGTYSVNYGGSVNGTPTVEYTVDAFTNTVPSNYDLILNELLDARETVSYVSALGNGASIVVDAVAVIVNEGTAPAIPVWVQQPMLVGEAHEGQQLILDMGRVTDADTVTIETLTFNGVDISGDLVGDVWTAPLALAWAGIDPGLSASGQLRLTATNTSGSSVSQLITFGIDPKAADQRGKGYTASTDYGTSVDGMTTVVLTDVDDIQTAINAASGPTAILLNGGTYRQNFDLINKTDLKVQPYGTTNPTVTGREPLTGWTLVTGDPLLEADDVYSTTLPLASLDHGFLHSLSLSDNGVIRNIAQSRRGETRNGFFYDDRKILDRDQALTPATYAFDGSGYINNVTCAEEYSKFTAAQAGHKDVLMEVYFGANLTNLCSTSNYDHATHSADVATLHPTTNLIDGSNGVRKCALVNIPAALRYDEWAAVESGGTVTVYWRPLDVTNLDARAEYAARSHVMRVGTVTDVEVNGLTIEGSDNHARFFASTVQNITGTKTRLKMNNNNIGHAGRADYGLVYLADLVDCEFSNNTLHDGGRVGFHIVGSNNLKIKDNLFIDLGNSGFRTYNMITTLLYGNTFIRLGLSVHGNDTSLYGIGASRCLDTVMHGNVYEQCYGYVTYQRHERILGAFNRIAGSFNDITEDNRAVVNQNGNVTEDNPGYTDFWVNNEFVLPPYAVNTDTGLDLGAGSDGTFASIVDTRNNFILTGGNLDPYIYAGVLTSRDLRSNNTYHRLSQFQEPGDGWALGTGEAVTDFGTLYDSLYGLSRSAPASSATGGTILDVIQAMEALFSENFRVDLNGDVIDPAAPPKGARLDRTVTKAPSVVEAYATKLSASDARLTGPVFPADVAAVTFELDVNMSDGGAGNMALAIYSGLAFEVEIDTRTTRRSIKYVVRDAGNVILFNSSTANGAFPIDTRARLLVSTILDRGDGQAELGVYVDDVRVGSLLTSASNSSSRFSTARSLTLLGESGVDMDLYQARIWHEYTGDGDVSGLGSPVHDVEGAAANWNTPASGLVKAGADPFT